MSRRQGGSLRLGSAVVELLIPHRRPFLMVDFIDDLSLTPVARLVAGRHISANEPVFDGHFPEMPLWPGALTMEGLGQSAVILLTLRTLIEGARARGDDPEDALEALRNLDRGFRLHPGYRPNDDGRLGAALGEAKGRLAMGAAVDMKFLRPVLPGCRLDYEVEVTKDLGARVRFTGVASVDGEPVAKGTITAALAAHPLRAPLGG